MGNKHKGSSFDNYIRESELEDAQAVLEAYLDIHFLEDSDNVEEFVDEPKLKNTTFSEKNKNDL